MAQEICCGVRPEQILTVPYGSNAQNIIHEYVISGPLKILFVGNVNYNKGITYLIDATSTFEEDEVTLTIVGLYDKNKAYINKCKNKKNISVVGKLDFEEVCGLYRTTDVLVIDSFAEGLAQVGLEAMSCGIPIICSTNSGVNDAIINGNNGFIIQPGNLKELKEAIGWFVKNQDKLKLMGENARISARAYTWENYEKHICKKLRDLLEGNYG